MQTKYIDQVSVEYLGAECALVFKFNTIGVAAGIGGKHIVLVMNQLGNLWRCTSQDIAQRYLPSRCDSI